MRNVFILIGMILTLPFAGHAADFKQEEAKPPMAQAYLPPTLSNLSKLYWKMSMLDLKKDLDVDNYMLINECDIYRDYFHNEFEWKNIRETARIKINEKRKDFPVRFEFFQPLKLGDYNIQAGLFQILDEYRVPATTRFELESDDFYRIICDQSSSGQPVNIPGYPRTIITEFSRPFSLDTVPVTPEKARAYIDLKMQAFNKLAPSDQTPDRLYGLRDASIVLRVKFVSPKALDPASVDGSSANLLAILEGYRIYGDKERTMLLYEKTLH